MKQSQAHLGFPRNHLGDAVPPFTGSSGKLLQCHFQELLLVLSPDTSFCLLLTLLRPCLLFLYCRRIKVFLPPTSDFSFARFSSCKLSVPLPDCSCSLLLLLSPLFLITGRVLSLARHVHRGKWCLQLWQLNQTYNIDELVKTEIPNCRSFTGWSSECLPVVWLTLSLICLTLVVTCVRRQHKTPHYGFPLQA